MKQLYEANMDKVDAVIAARDFPHAFKSQLIKFLKMNGIEIDTIKSFKDKPYELYGSLKGTKDREPGWGARSDNAYLSFFLRDGTNVTIVPDRVGSVIAIIRDVEYNVRIAGRNVREFADALALVMSGQGRTRVAKKPSPKEEDFKNLLSGFDFINRVELSSGYVGYSSDYEYNLSIVYALTLSEEDEIKLSDFRKYLGELQNIFSHTALKSVYKKATGQSIGKNEDRDSLLYRITELDLSYVFTYNARNYAIPVYNAVSNLIHDSGFYISNIIPVGEFWSRSRGNSIKISFRKKEQYMNNRGIISSGKEVNIYHYVRDLNKYKKTVDDVIREKNVWLEGIISPVTKKIISILFKDDK